MIGISVQDNVFDINPLTGQIFIKDPTNLNYEGPQNVYTATLQVTDDGMPGAGMRLTAVGTVTINVLNVNERPAVAATSFAINENSVPGTIVGGLAPFASDPDAGDAASLRYTIVSQEATLFGEQAFSINPTTGVISVQANGTGHAPRLDFETKATYVLQVKATDTGGLDSLPAQVVVRLNNVNEPPIWLPIPRFYARALTPQIVGQALSRYAVDPDLAVPATGEQLLFFFPATMAGNDANTFDLDALTGQLDIDNVTAPLVLYNASNPRVYNLSIYVQDAGINHIPAGGNFKT